jgi:hypothetical protein
MPQPFLAEEPLALFAILPLLFAPFLPHGIQIRRRPRYDDPLPGDHLHDLAEKAEPDPRRFRVAATAMIPSRGRRPQNAAMIVRTERNFLLSIRFFAVRQYCSYSKTPTEENGHALHQRFYVQSN